MVLGLVGEGVDVVESGPDIEIEVREGEQRSSNEDDADDRIPHHGARHEILKPPPGGIGILHREPGEEGDAEEVHFGAEQVRARRGRSVRVVASAAMTTRMAPRASDW